MEGFKYRYFSRKYMKRLIIILFLVSLVSLNGCAEEKSSKDEDFFCYEPYFEYREGKCCLDENKDQKCDEPKSNEAKPSSTPSSTSSLTETQKREICNDLDAWYDYCSLKGIDINTCSTQAVEKVKRIYGLSDSQLFEISDYCWG